MHGCSSASVLLVNAEVDSMGGVVEGGIGVGTKNSPRRAAIEKVQAELRQEYDVREDRRRELEFLEKGGNPLDFKFGNAASVSVQSTSLTDQHYELFVTSEAKGSFAFTASPHGDSVESSGRPGAHSTCEPNSADNLMLFDAENDSVEGDRNSLQARRNNITPIEHSLRLDGNRNTKEFGDSGAFGLPRKAYRRRNRSRPSRDAARSSPTDVALARDIHGSSLLSRHSPRDAKDFVSDADDQKNQKVCSDFDLKPMSPIGVTVCKTVPSDNQLGAGLDDIKAVESTNDQTKDDASDAVSDANALKTLRDDEHKESVFVAHKTSTNNVIEESESCKGLEKVVSVSLACQPCVDVTQVDNQASSGQTNGFITAKGDDKIMPNDGPKRTTSFGTKVLDSESSCTQTSLSLDGNNDSEMCTKERNIDSNSNVKEQTSALEGKPPVVGSQMVNEEKEIRTDGSCTLVNSECNSVQQSHKENGFILKAKEELSGNVSNMPNDVKNQNQNEITDQIVKKSMDTDGCDASKTEGKNAVSLVDNPKDENICMIGRKDSCGSSVMKVPEAASLPGLPSTAPEQQISSDINLKPSKAYEDSILAEAQIIEAKRKRIAELSVATLRMDYCRKSHWDYVLEEMAWLANDFAQERLWKITAAAQICNRAASASQQRLHEQNNSWGSKKVACILARAVMEFWNSVEETQKDLGLQCPEKDSTIKLREYAARFLKINSSDVLLSQAEAPATPDRISGRGIVDMPLDDHLREEKVFYMVPPGAMGKYRDSVESHVKYEKTISSMQEEVETSACEAVADYASQDNVYEEEEGETSTYDTSVAFEASKSSRFAQRKWKSSAKPFNARSFEVVADSPFMQCMENRVGSQQPILTGKRPASSLNVSFPTKRVRTSNRPRVLSPFSAGTSAYVQMPTKTDASSGDTNSFQDDQSTLHGGSHMPNNLEVESVGDFEKHLAFDYAEVSTKSKKKKKAKNLGSAYDQRWQQVDSNFQNEQRDLSKRRLENYQLESNGSTGLFGQHLAKKPKTVKQSLDNSFDSAAPLGGSAPSPVASQISNPNKFIKYFGGRDRGRKNKTLKMSANQQGSGSPWSLFEEQALVVLVHDLGPNWELVSDAINSTLQFKCIFRNPKECKDRHKLLMDRNAGDGADSAEDSGSSQPYNSTLPGIPKGSARQLFQRLQGPMEEDTLKSHFEKIIIIGQKLHSRRKQNESQYPKQLEQPHGSHMLALTQVCPNNLNGGAVLTPLDLCDATASSPDMLPLGYQGPHTGALAISNQGTLTPLLTAPGANASAPGSSSVNIGNNFSSPSGPINGSVREGRYAVPRSASLSIDEQQRMQQYNQMMSGRSIPQSNLPSPGALPGNDRGVRGLPGGSGMGLAGGINRSLQIARPGFQGIASSSMLNSGSMMSSGMVAVPGPVNVHAGVATGQGNSLRPRDALHMMRPNQNQDPQRQVMVPDLQMKASQGNSQGVAPFGAISSSFPNQTATSSVSSYPLHQQSHAMSPQQSHVISPHHPHLQGANHSNPQHQGYAIRMAKERQLHQRFMMQQQQQQQQFASSNSMMPHVQPLAQLPISTPPPNSSQIQSQAAATPVSHSPLTAIPQHQQKHQMLPQGLARNAQSASSGPTNPMGKQRQRQAQQQQPFQQASRHHPQQRQQPQSQQQAKLVKGVGRGNMMMHQNLSIDPSLMNGLSANPGNQSSEKGEQTMHALQGQGLYPGSAMNPAQSGKPLVPHSSSQTQPHQKMYSGQASQISKHLQQMPYSDSNNQGHISPVASSPSLSTGHQSVPPLVMASSSHHQPQLQPHQKLVNQSQPSVQRALQQNHHMNDPSTKVQGRESQVEQIPMTNLSQVGTTPMIPQASNDATNLPQVISPASSQWRGPESLYDSGTSSQAANLNSVGTLPANSSGAGPSSQAGHGLGQRQSSGNLPPVGHDVGTPWQQQPSPLQQPPSPVSQQQPQQQVSQQLTPLSLSQQQAQLVGNSSLYVRSTDSRLE